MKLLLVEDDLNLAAATSELLGMLGHEVALAHSVGRAFDALSVAHEFQVILLDLRLGTERGEAIFSRLRALTLRYPPVIIVSAQPHRELIEAANEVRAVKVLSKPASADDLARALIEVAASAPVA